MKDPKKVKAGQIGAKARWGEPRTVRLDDLTPAQRRLVMALIEAAREVNAEREPYRVALRKVVDEALAEPADD